jgi:hypothetical protein
MKRETRKKTNIAAGSSKPQDINAGIAGRAYEIWLNEGCRHGRDLEHWLQAEHELAGKPPQASAQNC